MELIKTIYQRMTIQHSIFKGSLQCTSDSLIEDNSSCFMSLFPSAKQKAEYCIYHYILVLYSHDKKGLNVKLPFSLGESYFSPPICFLQRSGNLQSDHLNNSSSTNKNGVRQSFQEVNLSILSKARNSKQSSFVKDG